MKLSFNKKGDVASIIYLIISVLVIGILFFTVSHMTRSVYDKFDDILEANPKYNDTVAEDTLDAINTVEQSVWDYAFLIIAIGSMIVLMITSYSVRINPAFFWIYIIMAIVMVFLGVVGSNMWQVYAAAPEYTDTLARFPIMNNILGTNFPLYIFGIILFSVILLFGKSSNEGGVG